MLENKNFYDATSRFYDQMINFDDNLSKMKIAFENLFPAKFVVADIGCGSGVDSIALATNGHSVFGFDPSSKMIELAFENAKKLGVEINFNKNSILNIPSKFNQKFDIVVSLGNTLANIEGDTIYSTIQRFYDLLHDGGQILIHILNYQLIMEKQERIVSIKPNNDFYFVRFYDFINGDVNFNILKFSKEKPMENQLLTTRVFPYKKDLLVKVFSSVGFKDIKLLANLDGEKFNLTSSKDLFILAIR
jgi:glycine/sarcosine N-methyltransferase